LCQIESRQVLQDCAWPNMLADDQLCII
jgi:hypothetical protein